MRLVKTKVVKIATLAAELDRHEKNMSSRIN